MLLLTGLIALFTGGLIVVGYLQWRTYEATLQNTRTIERAYVDISHDQPGLNISPHQITFSLAVKNHGRTPANVARPVMFLALAETGDFPTEPERALTEHPSYGTPAVSPMGYFLMPGESFHSWELRPSFPQDVLAGLQDSTRTLWLIGFVDYIDHFGRTHRAGYARRYIHAPLPGTSNNLVFELKPGYNYDIDL
jgi:hypothetical protein